MSRFQLLPTTERIVTCAQRLPADHPNFLLPKSGHYQPQTPWDKIHSVPVTKSPTGRCFFCFLVGDSVCCCLWDTQPWPSPSLDVNPFLCSISWTDDSPRPTLAEQQSVDVEPVTRTSSPKNPSGICDVAADRLVPIRTKLRASGPPPKTPILNKLTGVYTSEQKIDLILRRRWKKNRPPPGPEVKNRYACRREFADVRPRKGGRFVALDGAKKAVLARQREKRRWQDRRRGRRRTGQKGTKT